MSKSPLRLTFAASAALLAAFGTRASGYDLTAHPFTPEGENLKLRREFTALGFAPEVTRESILEYIRERRGGDGPLEPDDDNPMQLVLIDAQGKKWKAETDGGAVEIKDSLGRMPYVFEAKAQWFRNHELDRMHLVLGALRGVGARPSYVYGGGHIHLELKGWLEKHPVAFASLVNLALTYEPILRHLMSHQRRVENARPLGMTRMSAAQLAAAWPGVGEASESRPTLANYLGQGLNRLLRDAGADCEKDPVLSPYMEKKWKTDPRGRCILAFVSHFGHKVVGAREFAINLQSWRGAESARKRHDSIEFRLFNAPITHEEAALEERLVRMIGDRAIRAVEQPILYRELVAPYYDLDSFYHAYFPELRRGHFESLLRELGASEAIIVRYLAEYLDEAKSRRRRSAPEPKF